MTPVNHAAATSSRSPTGLTRRAFLLAALATAALASDRAHGGVTRMFNRALGNEAPQRLAVVLVDVTGSIGSADWALYQRSFDALVASNRPGDRVVVAAIGDRPVSKFIAHADRAIPLKHKRLEDELALKRSNAALAEDFRQLRAQASTPAKATYILDAISATGQLFDQARRMHHELTLLILSDMIEESPAANFTQTFPDPAAAQVVITKRRHQGLLPDLHDVRVYVTGAGGKTGVQMARIQHFWTAFFAATNAAVRDYGRNPVAIER